MNAEIVKILETEYITHDVKRFRLEKPAGFVFKPGQAVELANNKPGQENELRPFTMTSIPTEPFLEFIIKIYDGHQGVTSRLANLTIGDEVIVHEVFGTIEYKGPGLFIAAGSGITPFLAMLKQLKYNRDSSKHYLLFANKTEKDIILKEQLREALGENYINILSEQTIHGMPHYIDKAVLRAYTNKDISYFYICGPDPFVDAITGYLLALGIKREQIIKES